MYRRSRHCWVVWKRRIFKKAFARKKYLLIGLAWIGKRLQKNFEFVLSNKMFHLRLDKKNYKCLKSFKIQSLSVFVSLLETKLYNCRNSAESWKKPDEPAPFSTAPKVWPLTSWIIFCKNGRSPTSAGRGRIYFCPTFRIRSGGVFCERLKSKILKNRIFSISFFAVFWIKFDELFKNNNWFNFAPI